MIRLAPPLNGSRVFENLTESAGHLDVRSGLVQPGHPGKEDIQTKRIDRSQLLRVNGHFAGRFDAFVQNMN